jgi:phage terminase large subunit-like protein
VMVTGRSGLLAVARTGERPTFHRTDGIVRFPTGAEAFLYSGACPEKLRGPEHHFAWCDEIAKWQRPEETWDNLQLGLRLGRDESGPRVLVTTTPKALPLLKRLVATSLVSRGRTADNPHLPPAFVARMEADYRGTRKAREELDGELIEEAEGALWSRALIERCRCDSPSPGLSPEGERGGFARIVIGVDPPATAHGDACGIVACALGADGIGYVIGDHSARGLSPEGWAAKVVAAAQGWGADCVVVLKTADPALPVRPVHARYGKGDRAEPVAMLFEKGAARFAGAFPELEDELCALTRGGGFAGPGWRGRSPDRADAMVWAMTELMLGRPRPPVRVRQL